jgi:glycosyltransferase involved in cell wall biosynthesis
MRILQVNSAQTLGGGETHVIQLTKKLRDLGHEVQIAGRPDSPLNPDIVLPFRNSSDFFSALRLRRLLRDDRFDVVHAHMARDYPVVAAATFRMSHPVVVFTRHLLHPVKRNPFYRRADGWLAPTQEILKTLESLKPNRAAVVSNWVDSKQIAFSPHSLHSPVHLGILGQISAHKGHDDAVDALRLLGPDFRLFVAGDGKADYIEQLKQRAQGLSVEFVGFADPVEFFREIDVLLVPSWHEPFGIVLLEAMAAGVPVISTARGGPLEIIRSGETGLLVPPKDPSSLAEAIRQLTVPSGLCQQVIEKARFHVERDFSIDPAVHHILEFYQSVG